LINPYRLTIHALLGGIIQVASALNTAIQALLYPAKLPDTPLLLLMVYKHARKMKAELQLINVRRVQTGSIMTLIGTTKIRFTRPCVLLVQAGEV
jgi:hypothetical protein